MSERMLIGLAGYSGSGKDTVGDILVGNHLFASESFAGGVKAAMIRLVERPVCMFDNQLKDEVIQGGGFKGLTYREAMIDFGEAMKRTFGEDFWIQHLLLKYEEWLSFKNRGPGFVVTDVRFPQEARWIAKKGGVVWRITRPGCDGVFRGGRKDPTVDDRHITIEIINNGTLAHLADAVRQALIKSQAASKKGVQTIRAF